MLGVLKGDDGGILLCRSVLMCVLGALGGIGGYLEGGVGAFGGDVHWAL